MKYIEVVTVVSESQAMFFAVMGTSLLQNTPTPDLVRFNVIDCNLSIVSKERLASLLKQWGGNVRFLTAPTAIINIAEAREHRDSIALIKLYFAEILNDVSSRVLLLDCDLLIHTDISQLWNFDLENFTAGACQDMAIPYMSSLFGVQNYKCFGALKNDQYLNSGVLLIDLSKWRALTTPQQLRELYNTHQYDLNHADQDIFNMLLVHKWKKLDERWNVIFSVSQKGERLSMTTDSTTDRAILGPHITHFAGYLKPTRFTYDTPAIAYFNKVLAQTPWNEWRFKPSLKTLMISLYFFRLRKFLYPIETRLLFIYRRTALKVRNVINKGASL